jgi:hypothetical protein
MTLTPADEPGTGGGTYDETTIDFGFYNVTPSIYVSATQADSVQTFDATTGLYTGPLVSGFGNSLSQGNTDWGDLPYAIEFGQDGNWYVAHYGASNLRKISPAGLDLGPVLDNSNASVSLDRPVHHRPGWSLLCGGCQWWTRRALPGAERRHAGRAHRGRSVHLHHPDGG